MRSTRSPLLLLLATLLAALALTACGGSGSDDGADVASLGKDTEAEPDQETTSTTLGFQDGMLQYARCMRGEGIDYPDPGPDGTVGTADDPGRTITYWDFPAQYAGARNQEPMLVNDSAANQSFKSGEFAVTRRLANRWHMYASYSFTKRHIPIIPNAGTQTGVTIYVNTVDPNSEINNDDNTTEWMGRVQGSYVFPFDITTSLNYEHRSGEPQRRTVILRGGRQIPQITLPAEELGSVWRLPHINLVDLNVQKTFRLQGSHSATIRMNVFNLLNANTFTGRTMQSGPNFGTITGILLPRIGEVAVSYRF